MAAGTDIPQHIGWLFTPIFGLVAVHVIAAWRACQAYPGFRFPNDITSALLPWWHNNRDGRIWALVFWISGFAYASLIFLVFWLVEGDKVYALPSAEQMDQVRVPHSGLQTTVFLVAGVTGFAVLQMVSFRKLATLYPNVRFWNMPRKLLPWGHAMREGRYWALRFWAGGLMWILLGIELVPRILELEVSN